MPEKSPGRPKGRRNTKPSRRAVAAYYRLLQDKADQGDVAAAGKLLELDLLDRRACSHQSEISGDGV